MASQFKRISLVLLVLTFIVNTEASAFSMTDVRYITVSTDTNNVGNTFDVYGQLLKLGTIEGFEFSVYDSLAGNYVVESDTVNFEVENGGTYCKYGQFSSPFMGLRFHAVIAVQSAIENRLYVKIKMLYSDGTFAEEQLYRIGK